MALGPLIYVFICIELLVSVKKKGIQKHMMMLGTCAHPVDLLTQKGETTKRSKQRCNVLLAAASK